MAVATECMARAPLRARTEDAEDAEEAVEPKDAEDFAFLVVGDATRPVVARSVVAAAAAAGGGEGTMGGGRTERAAAPDSASDSELTRESARYCSRCK